MLVHIFEVKLKYCAHVNFFDNSFKYFSKSLNSSMKKMKKIKENYHFFVYTWWTESLVSHLEHISYFLIAIQIYDPYIRSKVLSIVYSCTSMLGTMSGVYKVFWLSDYELSEWIVRLVCFSFKLLTDQDILFRQKQVLW